jgi:hypothetical protein
MRQVPEPPSRLRRYGAPSGFVQYVPSPGMDGIYPGRDACPHIVVLPVQGCCDPEFYCRKGGEMVSVTSEECLRCKERNDGQVCE